ncbi:MAG: tyrosine-type recombinase/integrase [Prevotella sp.]|nr:tyrosine-type recombinase/integrase [Prevotella sp.]
MAKKSAVKVVWDRRGLAAKRGHGYVEIAIYLGPGQRKYLSFGKATLLEWQKVQKSKELRLQVEKYEKLINAMETLGEEMTIENFESHLVLNEVVEQQKEAKGMFYNGFDLTESFIDYMRENIEEEHIEENTRIRKLYMVDTVEAFGLMNTFADITAANIIAYDKFLHKGNRTDATVFSYHKRLKFYIHQAKVEERIPSNPYEQVKFKRGCYKERKPLTEAELKELRDFTLDQEKLDRVRDLFIFMAYTGLSHCDLCLFKFKPMTEKVGNLYYIDGRRLKTHTEFFTPILQPAMDVLKKYNFKLPVITNQKMNDYLHVIEERMELTKPLTCHVARHSFATLCLAHGTPIETVAKMLGHTKIETTQIYAKVLRSTLKSQSESLAAAIV